MNRSVDWDGRRQGGVGSISIAQCNCGFNPFEWIAQSFLCPFLRSTQLHSGGSPTQQQLAHYFSSLFLVRSEREKDRERDLIKTFRLHLPPPTSTQWRTTTATATTAALSIDLSSFFLSIVRATCGNDVATPSPRNTAPYIYNESI